jgi:hypothetical protein
MTCSVSLKATNTSTHTHLITRYDTRSFSHLALTRRCSVLFLFHIFCPVILDELQVCLESFQKKPHDENENNRPLNSFDVSQYGGVYGASFTSSAQLDTLLNQTEPSYLPSQQQYKPCSQMYMEQYLNTHRVRTALHVLDRASYKWSPCGGIKYNSRDVDTPVIALYQQLVDQAVQGKNNLKILIYSGDDDSICATAGTQDWIWGLGLQVKTMWQAWRADLQTSGFVTRFDLGNQTNATFTFVTVHGAGHEVPAYKPREAFALFKTYIDGKW